MNPENQHFEPAPQQPAQTEDDVFDVAAAERERLAWRLGGEDPTERALGRDASLARENQEAVDRAREAAETEEAARKQRLNERLGGVASQELRPDDN